MHQTKLTQLVHVLSFYSFSNAVVTNYSLKLKAGWTSQLSDPWSPPIRFDHLNARLLSRLGKRWWLPCEVSDRERHSVSQIKFEGFQSAHVHLSAEQANVEYCLGAWCAGVESRAHIPSAAKKACTPSMQENETTGTKKNTAQTTTMQQQQ